MLLLLKSYCFAELVRRNGFGRADARTRYLEAQLTIHEASIDEIIQRATLKRLSVIKKHYFEIYSEPFIQAEYPGVEFGLIKALHRFLTSRQACRAVLERFASDPYQYRKGWPDLTVSKRGSVSFLEVKTTDLLHESQVRTYWKMRPLIGDRWRVIHLSPAHPQLHDAASLAAAI